MHSSPIHRLPHRPARIAARLARLGAVALLAALSGCISTALVAAWKDPSYAGPPLHKVLVVAVERNAGQRRIWESAMVQALQRQHVAASPSYQLYPDKTPTAKQLADAAHQQGFDGVLATSFVRAVERTRFVPDWFGPSFGWGWGYFGWWNAAYGSGYLESDVRQDFQTDVFTVAPDGGRLIWTGTTRSVDLDSAAALTDQISRVLVPELMHQGILSSS